MKVIYDLSYTIGIVLVLVDTPIDGVNTGTVGTICGITAKLRSCATTTGLSVPDPAHLPVIIGTLLDRGAKGRL